MRSGSGRGNTRSRHSVQLRHAASAPGWAKSWNGSNSRQREHWRIDGTATASIMPRDEVCVRSARILPSDHNSLNRVGSRVR